MNNPSKSRDILRRSFYPELLAAASYLTYISLLIQDFFCKNLFIGVAIINALAVLVLLFKFEKPIKETIVIVMMAVTIGLLQFNYLPSISLWLLLFYRLMVIPKHRSVSLALFALVIAGFTILTVENFLPKFNLDNDFQAFLNHISVSFTAIIFGYYLWQMLLKVQHYRQKSETNQQHITKLVSITNKLTRFMPPQVWQPIILTNPTLNINNERKKLTILFSDIAGFTELSDELSSDHLANILNTYFEQMTTIANKYNATLDKFLGDGMLCFFGDKQSEGEKADAIKCANMALEMRQAMQLLRSKWRLLGFEGLYVRIGINTGYCHVGNFGSPQRMAYTVIGKTANLAARLEAAAQKNQILVTETTYDLIASEHRCILAGHYQFKGIKEAIPVWELLNPQELGEASNWLNYELPGFNLHLNFNDIKNYDEKQIRKSLTQALEQLEAKTPHKSV